MKEACPAPDVLAAFASGELPAAAKAPIEQHVSQCDECLETIGYLMSKVSQSGTSGPSGPSHRSLAEAEQIIGPYRLVRRIGEGGMGEVWEAQQVSPVRRTVALKLLKAGMDTRQIITRFEAERQVLALMQHPSIAQVFDAGITDSGRPYFVMEYVDGVRITAYCDRAGLNVRQRLTLFQQVCEAVQHAHQKGVIHRDLKPSNVLVTTHAGKPLPKVIDFGLAKATTSETEGTLLTELGTLLGTPAYASPEQMSLGVIDIDTRSDVYSLGALLYELLVGVIPFETVGAQPLAVVELRRAIRERDPTRPSARLPQLGERLSQIAQSRGSEPQALRKQLRGDVDWIVMKALEKERDRRYSSPHELSRDIARYLDHEPLQAGPPTTAYRVRKFVRRHRIATAFAATIAMLLITFVATVLVQSQRIARERDRATAEAAKASSINTFLQETLGSADPWETGKDISIREVLDNAAKRAETEFSNQPLVAAAVQRTIGSTYLELGRYQEAEALLQSALATRKRVLGNGHVDVGQSSYDLAVLYKLQSKYPEAEKYIREALATHRKAVGESHTLVAEDLEQLALVLFYRGDYATAAKEGEAALAMLEQLHGKDGIELTSTLEALAIIVGQGLGDYARSEQLHGRSYEIGRKNYGPNDYRTAFSAANLASQLSTQGKLERAEALFREALPVMERSVSKDHPEFASVLENYGGVMFKLKRYDESLALVNKVLEIRRARLGEDSPKVARTMLNIATVQTFANRLDEAAASYAEAVPRLAKAYGEDHPDVAIALFSYGRLRAAQKQLDAAESLFERAFAIQQRKLPDDHPSMADTRTELAKLLLERKAYAKAEPLLLSAYAVRLKVFGPKSAKTIDTAEQLVTVYTALGKPTQAAEYRLAATPQ